MSSLYGVPRRQGGAMTSGAEGGGVAAEIDSTSLVEQLPNLLPYDGIVVYCERFLPDDLEWFHRLEADIDWRSERARFFGREVPLPRLTAWYGPAPYAYSGVVHGPRPIPEFLRPLTALVTAASGPVDCLLANLYRTGQDAMGWHADDERLFGRQPLIASLSLGATRRFALRHRRSHARIDLDLTSGSLLVMAGTCQENWVHSVPRTRRPVGPRINLTFRRLAAPATAPSDEGSLGARA